MLKIANVIGGHIFCQCGREMAHLGYDPVSGNNYFLCPCGKTSYLGSEI